MLETPIWGVEGDRSPTTAGDVHSGCGDLCRSLRSVSMMTAAPCAPHTRASANRVDGQVLGSATTWSNVIATSSNLFSQSKLLQAAPSPQPFPRFRFEDLRVALGKEQYYDRGSDTLAAVSSPNPFVSSV